MVYKEDYGRKGFKVNIRIALLVVVSMLITWSSAVAEDFSFLSGTTFKSTLSDIAEKEGFSADWYSSDCYKSVHNEPPAFHEYPYLYETQNRTVADIPESHIAYYFNSQQVLREVVYFFRSSYGSDYDFVAQDFERINQALEMKYGDCYNRINLENSFPVKSAMFEEFVKEFNSEIEKQTNDSIDFSEWVIDCSEYKVKIEHFIFSIEDSFSGILNGHALCYSYFTSEDLYAIQNPTPTPTPEPAKNILDDL